MSDEAFYDGQWVKRERAGSKYHRVMTVTAGDMQTMCGRRLAPIDAAGRKLRFMTRNLGYDQLRNRCTHCR